jgi:hypothetical protein
MDAIALTSAVPQASLREVATILAVQRAGWTMRQTERRVPRWTGATSAPAPAPEVTTTLVRTRSRRATAVAALRRLAADPGATAAERALAAQRVELLEH